MLQPLLLGTSRKPPMTTLSFGGGQDSAALLNLLIADPTFRQKYAPGLLTVVMSDTGDEYTETLTYVEQVKQLCQAHGITFIHVTPDLGFHSPAWQSLYGQWDRNHTIQSLAFGRTCSSNLKLGPLLRALNAHVAQVYGYAPSAPRRQLSALYAYAAEHGPMPMMIGFAAGEERRVKPAQTQVIIDTMHRIYPLIDLGLNRRGCQETIHALGGVTPYPSNCRSCPFASAHDLLRLELQEPAALARWMAAEERKLAAPKWQGTRNHTVFANDLTIRQSLERAHRKYPGIDLQELNHIRFQRGHATTTSF